MTTNLKVLLSVGGHTNSLGKVEEVIALVIANDISLSKLYKCMQDDDPWVRMRAADAFEKICRTHPAWITPYIPRIQRELSHMQQQPSIQWHIAQIYRQVELSKQQTQNALAWLFTILSSPDRDWIVAAQAMETLAYFTEKGVVTVKELLHYITIQQQHASQAVIKKARKIQDAFSYGRVDEKSTKK